MIAIMTSCADVLAGRAPKDAAVVLKGWIACVRAPDSSSVRELMGLRLKTA